MRVRLSNGGKDILFNGIDELRRIGNLRDPFVRMAEILPQLSAHQFCHY
ncbi:12999_t:CDS:2 [Rhizophagus irregularis]|nr:12999_t:CDS:2 [Rhizophagus irregularis]